MANIKTTPKQWERAKEFYEAGLSLAQVSEKVRISKAQIGKRAASERWSKETEKKNLLAAALKVEMAKGELSETAKIVHEELLSDKVRQLRFFTNAAVLNVQGAMQTSCANQNDFRARADTILKGKETVLGKAPDTAIQINTHEQSLRDLMGGK